MRPCSACRVFVGFMGSSNDVLQPLVVSYEAVGAPLGLLSGAAGGVTVEQLGCAREAVGGVLNACALDFKAFEDFLGVLEGIAVAFLVRLRLISGAKLTIWRAFFPCKRALLRLPSCSSSCVAISREQWGSCKERRWRGMRNLFWTEIIWTDRKECTLRKVAPHYSINTHHKHDQQLKKPSGWISGRNFLMSTNCDRQHDRDAKAGNQLTLIRVASVEQSKVRTIINKI